MTVKLSLHVSDALNARIEHMAATNHCTKSDILRRAVALIEVMDGANKSGQALAVIDAETKRLVSEVVMV